MATRQIPWARLWAEGVAMSRDEIMALPPDSVQPYLRALGSACFRAQCDLRLLM